MTNKINTIVTLGILIISSLACNFSFSTANLSDLKFGKDKNATGTNVTFKPEDEIFVVTEVNNASGKHKVKFKVMFDKVEGAQAGSVAYKLEQSVDVETSRPLWFNFSVPGGFDNGTYKAEVVLINEDGKEIDRKTGSFTVAGGNSSKSTKTETQTTDQTKPDAEENKDSDDK